MEWNCEVKWSESHSTVSDSSRPHGLYSSWNSPGQNTGVGSLSLLQGVFPTQGSNLRLPHCRWILYQLSQEGSPRKLECVAYPFSSRSSQPRNRTRVSFIAGGFLTSWATREALTLLLRAPMRLAALSLLLVLFPFLLLQPLCSHRFCSWRKSPVSFRHVFISGSRSWELNLWQSDFCAYI